MTPNDLVTLAIVPALSLLPENMDTVNARAMLVATALQESGLRHRTQQDGDDDPYDLAVGWWQFERIGVTGVQDHHATCEYAAGVNQVLGYPAKHAHHAVAHNDVLAAAYARLLLWRLPYALPERAETREAWDQYIAAWRPGKPHYRTWEEHYATAWRAVS